LAQRILQSLKGPAGAGKTELMTAAVELRTVVSIDEDKTIFDKGKIVRAGAALHLDQGIAVIPRPGQAEQNYKSRAGSAGTEPKKQQQEVAYER
jgi:hypothetical protein